MRKVKVWLTLLFLGLVWCCGGKVSPTVADGEWIAEYFANPTLSGGPVLVRAEPVVNFSWGNGSPGEGVPADNFSARFTRDAWFAGGTYRFSYLADDGIRLWVDDKLIVDEWHDGSATWHTTERVISGGVHHVKVEYFEHGGWALLKVAWEPYSGNQTWDAAYFNNTDFSGQPALVRHDTAIDFDWGTGSPDPAVSADNFCVHWSRTLGFEGGTYRFYASSDDGMRIYVDGKLVVNAWRKQKLPNTTYGDVALSAGQHAVIVEYFEEGGEASAHAWWSRLDLDGGWHARYYANKSLRGGPALIRDDPEINFDWGEGAPVNWMPSDNFSVVWSRQIDFKPGLYRFNVRSDDGVRLWLDETDLRMDYWEPQDFVWRYQDWHYLSGPHTLRVEYFEQAGSAKIQFWWDYAANLAAAQAMPPSPVYGFKSAGRSTTSTTARATATPSRQTRPSLAEPTFWPGPWQGTYFDNRTLRGSPVLTRTDHTLHFDWGWKSPATEVPRDNFSARWTGEFTFQKGRYRFLTISDDGVRLSVDGKTIINCWRRMRGQCYRTVSLTAGKHAVQVEYFEATQAAKIGVSWRRLR